MRLVRKQVSIPHVNGRGPVCTVWITVDVDDPRDVEPVTQLRKAVLAAKDAGLRLNYADLKGADLSYMTLGGMSFIGANFEGAVLSGASMSRVFADKTNFHGARVAGTDFSGSHLDGALFNGADCEYAHFDGACLQNSSFAKANVYRAEFNGARVSRVTFRQAVLSPTGATYPLRIKRMVARAVRQSSGPYEFFLWQTNHGPWVTAGCQSQSLRAYYSHTKSYRGKLKTRETLRILSYFEDAYAEEVKNGRP